jgi:acyl-CoA thioester hydrolase
MKKVFEMELDVRWGDMDAVGHVNNAKYFTYFEQARIGWLDSLEVAAMSRRSGPVMATATCEFKQAILHPARIVVEVLVGNPGRSSLPTGYRIRDARDPGIEYASGTSILVWVDYTTNKSVPLPDAIRALAS